MKHVEVTGNTQLTVILGFSYNVTFMLRCKDLHFLKEKGHYQAANKWSPVTTVTCKAADKSIMPRVL